MVGIGSSSTINITDSYTSGNYLGNTYSGGLVGLMRQGTITRSYSSATITGNGGNDIGGLVGHLGDGAIVTDSFFAGSVSGNSISMGAVFGAANNAYSSVYYDVNISYTTACVGSGSCVAVNSGNSTPDYFKNNYTNPPLNSWNFAGVWKRTSTYPIFGIEPTPTVETATTTSSSDSATTSPTAPKCTDLAPESSPLLFQISTNKNQATLYFVPTRRSSSYFISYGYAPGDQRFGVEIPAGDTSGVNAYTINMLAPGTTYYFNMRAGQGCMPGEWGKWVKATTTKKSSVAKFYF